jgi:hypothetical protein
MMPGCAGIGCAGTGIGEPPLPATTVELAGKLAAAATAGGIPGVGRAARCCTAVGDATPTIVRLRAGTTLGETPGGALGEAPGGALGNAPGEAPTIVGSSGLRAPPSKGDGVTPLSSDGRCGAPRPSLPTRRDVSSLMSISASADGPPTGRRFPQTRVILHKRLEEIAEIIHK